MANINNSLIVLLARSARIERKESFKYTTHTHTTKMNTTIVYLVYQIFCFKKNNMKPKEKLRTTLRQTKHQHWYINDPKSEMGIQKYTKFSKQFCIMRVLHLDDSIF